MPRRAVVFFLDRSVGKHSIAGVLRERGAKVEVHDDHFERDTEDAEWIVEVSRRGWAILTKDRRIRYRPLERRAVLQAKARVFALSGGNLTGPEMAGLFARHLKRMEGIVAGVEPPFVAKVTRGAIHVEQLRR